MSRANAAIPCVALAACCAALAACATPPAPAPPAAEAEDWSGFGVLENILNWTPEQQMRGYRNMDMIHPTRPISASAEPYPLPTRPTDLSGVRYEIGDDSFDTDGFFEHNHVVGLLVIKGGEIVVERYAEGNTPETKWYSFSVAKSVVSMLIGAAVQDGYIKTLDAPVTDYLPILAGSAYAGVSIRDAMQMASGVEWNEDYTDPESDVASTGGSALDRLRYLSDRPRAAAPGEVFNYNTGETNLLGAVLRAAIGNNLSTYLENKIWGPFGMEHEANWLLLAPGGAEHGGCCLSATLRDYGRIGLFALRDGRLRDGTPVLPDGWMAESTTPSAANERYGRLWWLGGDGVYSAIGIYGQAIQVNPAEELIIVTHSAWPRATGREFSRHRAAFFEAVTGELDSMASSAAAQPEAPQVVGPQIVESNFAQQVVNEAAAGISNLKRLTVHTKAPEGSDLAFWSFASTDPGRLGRASDEEDLLVMESGEVVVLEESSTEVGEEGRSTVDVSYPLHDEDDTVIGVAGITLYYEVGAGETAEQAADKAAAQGKQIGEEIDRRILRQEHLSHRGGQGRG